LTEAARLHRRYFFDGFRERSAREVWAGIQNAIPPTLVARVERKQATKALLPARKVVTLRRGKHESDAGSELATRLSTRSQ
jgi:hypothetical protein